MRRNQRGSALVNALIFIAALAILGMSLSHLATTRLAGTKQRNERVQAEATAESGIEEIESREALAKRLLPEYQSARKSLKEGERISVVYDPESRRVKLTVKKN